MQPIFKPPEFLSGNTPDEIHQRMLSSLPEDIDDMPGGFPYDFTKPSAIEKSELIEFHLARAIMIAFPQYAWDEWLDLHGLQVNLIRNRAQKATGMIEIRGKTGIEIPYGSIFCTPSTKNNNSVFFETMDTVILDDGKGEVRIKALEEGKIGNVPRASITLMSNPIKGIDSIINRDPTVGGTERESNDDFYDRIAIEYQNSITFVGNDKDYIRWAKEAGAGDCIVIPNGEGIGTVKLVLLDKNGEPANSELQESVYNYIVSPEDRSKRLLPTACAKLSCGTIGTRKINFICTGIVYDKGVTSLEQIKADFIRNIRQVFANAKKINVLRYNDCRPILKNIPGLLDFKTFKVDNDEVNIDILKEEYPIVGNISFGEV